MAPTRQRLEDDDDDGVAMKSMLSNDEVESGGVTPATPIKKINSTKLWLHFFWVSCAEQLRAIVPVSVGLMLFKISVLRQGIEDMQILLPGLCAVVVGLTLFMFGLTYGVMPLGGRIGELLPQRLGKPAVMLLSCLLGIAVTFAEPALMSLEAASALVKPERSPLLYVILNDRGIFLVMFVGLGVGIATSVGMMRILYNWSMKPIIIALVPICMAFTYVCKLMGRDEAVGLAWDLGAVTTGPVTVPIVISLGVGVAKSAGQNADGMTGFGIVTLASLFPVLSVLTFIICAPPAVPNMELIGIEKELTVWEKTPVQEIISGSRAIIPLLMLMWFILKVLLREKAPVRTLIPTGEKYATIAVDSSVVPGTVVAWIGVIIFNIGLKHGLAKLGSSVGQSLPAVFVEMQNVPNSPFMPFLFGVAVAVAFSFALGFGATFAEPALNTLGRVVQELTNGAFGKALVLFAVSVGVGLGIAIGVTKLIFNLDVITLLTAFYPIAMAMTLPSTRDFTSVSWDSAGVTTGPVTVPLVMALGLGVGIVTHSSDGFGVLAMASVMPIMTMLATGLIRNFQPAVSANPAAGNPAPVSTVSSESGTPFKDEDDA